MSASVTAMLATSSIDRRHDRSASSSVDQQLDRASGAGTGEALLRRVAGGDELAFAGLFDLLGPVVCAIGARRYATEQGVERFVHGAFLALWCSAPGFLLQDLPAKAWVVDLLSRSIAAECVE